MKISNATLRETDNYGVFLLEKPMKSYRTKETRQSGDKLLRKSLLKANKMFNSLC
jgi:hypothetical protein